MKYLIVLLCTVLAACSDSGARQQEKKAGKDAASNKPTYVALLGLDEARRYAGTLREHALASLADYGARARRLVELADWITLRTH